MTTCNVCSSADLRPVVRIEDVPIFCNVQWRTKQEAMSAAKGTIDLQYCRKCGHLFNAAFDPAKVEYSDAYENSLHFSPRFREYAEQLVDRLVQKFNLRNKTVVEIGCGKGEFISLLSKAGKNKGFGFDASYEADRDLHTSSDAVTFVKDFFGPKYRDIDADFLCCQHVLEHIYDPVPFLRDIQGALDPAKQNISYYEVPNARFTIEDLGIWDLIYEHCSYFSAESAQKAFGLAGLEVIDSYAEFGNQFLCIETRANGDDTKEPPASNPSTDWERSVQQFGSHYADTIDEWNNRLQEMAAAGDKVAIWGAGSKGVTFLNCLDASHNVNFVVDINPNKVGQFVPGTGHQIRNIDELQLTPPTQVIVMNSVYQKEIEDTLRDKHISANVHCA